ncbi:3-hydroxyacyl-ACP dehydratase FabZ family protein [Enterovibrio sp. 27052020O]|uniref:3-hydroxyacyl-ACP dehydratase FabZ family protein n=1 Tax=Enterovibrio sp. 27052020O TaxID=3241166 RepID=UPI003890C96B
MNRNVIDGLRDTKGVLGKAAIRSILPYGDAFLFVDSVSDLTESNVVAQYKIPESSELINAHFKHVSMMPGVLMGEALAQAGIVLLHYRSEFEEETDVIASTVNQMRFKSPALPGDTLEAHVSIKAINRLGARLTGKSYVNGREVLSATFDLTFIKRKNLIEHISQHVMR